VSFQVPKLSQSLVLKRKTEMLGSRINVESAVQRARRLRPCGCRKCHCDGIANDHRGAIAAADP
jgi:hypothetical protein